MNHSDPACARHGADPGQVDISAGVIRIFERLGWATKVRWPNLARLDSRRRYPAQGEAAPRPCGPGDGVPGDGVLGGRRPAGCRRCPQTATGSDDRYRWIAVS